MKRRIWTVAVGTRLGSGTHRGTRRASRRTRRAKLEVTQAGHADDASRPRSTRTTIRPRASGSSLRPGRSSRRTRRPGTVLGPVKAIVKALDLAGADLPLDGQLVVAAPGQVPAATSSRVHSAATAPIATWLMVLSAAGQTLHGADVPRRDGGRPGRARARVHPDLPAAAGHARRALLVARRSARRCTAPSSRSTASSARSRSARGSRFWTPYNARRRARSNVGRHGRLARRDRSGRGDARCEEVGRGAVVTGSVTQAGQPRGGRVRDDRRAARVKAKLKTRQEGARSERTGSSRPSRSSGRSSARRGRDRRVGSTAVCAQLAPLLAPIPCVNPTVNGFTAKSEVVKKK